MNIEKYTNDILKALKEKEISKISKIINDFELETKVRQYNNLKGMDMPTASLGKSAKEIQADLKEFKQLLEKYDDGKHFNSNEFNEAALIASGIIPSKIRKSYTWLEQIRYFFMDCYYCEPTEEVGYIREYISNNNKIQKYLKHNHLKNLNIFFPHIMCNNRSSSSFLYNNTVCVYSWNDREVISLLRSTISSIGELYYIPVIRHGEPKNREELEKLRNKLIHITSNENLNNIEERTFFGDMFSLHIMSEDSSKINPKDLGIIYYLVEQDKQTILSLIGDFFENIIENNSKIESPDFGDHLKKYIF